MLSMIIVYGIATVVGVLVALTCSLVEGVVAGFAALGGLVTAWILLDIAKDTVERFYEKKYAPKKSDDAA